MFILPENINKIPIKFIDKIAHSDEIYSFIFEPQKDIEWREGMHSKLYLEIFGKVYNKTFSHASLMSEGHIRFTMRAKSVASAFKTEMKKLKPGDMLYMSKPEGNFDLLRAGRSVILVSNGVGLATYRPHILSYAENSEAIGCLTQINIDRTIMLFEDEFEQVAAQNEDFSSLYTSNRKEFYDTLKDEVNYVLNLDKLEPLVYIVGSTEFVESVYAYLEDMGMDASSLITDGNIDEGLRCSCGSSVVCDCSGHEAPEHEYDLEDILA